jgi:hypothetical protein
MAGHPSRHVSGATFNWLTLRLLPFQGKIGEYVEAGGTGMLMRQPLRHGGCPVGLWNPSRGGAGGES